MRAFTLSPSLSHQGRGGFLQLHKQSLRNVVAPVGANNIRPVHQCRGRMMIRPYGYRSPSLFAKATSDKSREGGFLQLHKQSLRLMPPLL